MLIIHHANEVWEDGQAEHVPSYSKVKLSTELTIHIKNGLLNIYHAAKCTRTSYRDISAVFSKVSRGLSFEWMDLFSQNNHDFLEFLKMMLISTDML